MPGVWMPGMVGAPSSAAVEQQQMAQLKAWAAIPAELTNELLPARHVQSIAEYEKAGSQGPAPPRMRQVRPTTASLTAMDAAVALGSRLPPMGAPILSSRADARAGVMKSTAPSEFIGPAGSPPLAGMWDPTIGSGLLLATQLPIDRLRRDVRLEQGQVPWGKSKELLPAQRLYQEHLVLTGDYTDEVGGNWTIEELQAAKMVNSAGGQLL